ncbi:class I SAM-dependent methyltransferase [Algoriphagus marincola]|uniref:class I SAM-dependent methyltransferase n=1 Tax=Algoriphagus marincola TaxID=264027 RepID=UPI00042143FE|nr:class I SAM-dependent methyltransferase [Algoriphagus marincola]
MSDYNRIGINYSDYRKPDKRIAEMIEKEIGNSISAVNIGAGTGLYEPKFLDLIAVEPSEIMINQRSSEAAPVIKASAEKLPFNDLQFDISLALLTVHHWRDLKLGLSEMKRVSNRQLIFTLDPEFPGFWMNQRYFPEIKQIDSRIFPGFHEIEEALGPMERVSVPIPSDCSDGFGSAYWARPEAYLSEDVRLVMSSFNKISKKKLKQGIDLLSKEIADGTWDRMFGHLRNMKKLDLGFYILSN